MCNVKILLVILGGLAICQAYNYGEALQNSLLFYEAQRSGKLPADQKVTWRHDSALGDKGENQEDLTGGYYDAGDYVKFGFPMACTITVLAWGIIDYGEAYSRLGLDYDARAALKWGTDYFIKAHVSANEFYGQVGHGQTDHNYWGRPEDMTMERPAYKIDTSKPGSDLAAETAAALASTSIVFKYVDPDYSNTLITHAKQLFDFALNYRGKYSDSISDAANYYGSEGYEDELVWGAVWLYKATGESYYLTKAEDLYNEFGIEYWNGNFNWNSKISGVDMLLGQITQNTKYLYKIQGYCDWMVYSQQKTPLGLVFLDTWGSLRHASNVAFICLEAASTGINSAVYREFAKKQIDYMLGDGGHSYVVGLGNNYPQYEHHRSSSCPDAPEECNWNTFNGPQPNAHILYGALVGGPDSTDHYEDSRQNAELNEVACDYNAGFQSALAALSLL